MEPKKLNPDDLRRALKQIDRGEGTYEVADQLRDHIAALEAEIARRKPSGQVADDEKELRDTLRVFTSYSPESRAEDEAALSRLATKAQGYETAVANNAVLLKVRRLVDRLASSERKPREER